MENSNTYDVIVIGAGHAGVEASLACSRMGKKTVVFTISMQAVGFMPCNPSIGGTGKGHLVKEIDALGGQMGISADNACTQSKILNESKGPAVHSLRMQQDKVLYHNHIVKTLQSQENLEIKQVEISNILVEDTINSKKKVIGVETVTKTKYFAKAVIIATGTFLNSKIYIGRTTQSSGPDGMRTSNLLSSSLSNIGIPLRKLKTGTPPRIHKRSIDFSKFEQYFGDKVPRAFSFLTDKIHIHNLACYFGYTNSVTHSSILDSIQESAAHNGLISSSGPRYCPSIEDKLVRFRDKERHQLFLERESEFSTDIYLQGMSTSLSENVQEKFIRSIKGLENAEITRFGYAIEYDSIDASFLKHTLESRTVEGLFCAGQFNGSSGYEEAAAQGLVAGINATLFVNNKEPLVFSREESYIGVLIDDMITKGTKEPYRMMTSRCEYRLLLRQDNADLRLTPIGINIGLVSKERQRVFEKRKQDIEDLSKKIKSTKLKTEELEKLSNLLQTSFQQDQRSVETLLKRPEVTFSNLEQVGVFFEENTSEKEVVEVEIKYAGYIEKQLSQVRKMKNLSSRKIPENIDYSSIKSLSNEAMQALKDKRPLNLGMASNLYGVTPSDIAVLMIYLEKNKIK